ncbi:MAG: TIGR04423 family type III CRISPR-associated protein [Bacteroidetes bacterium]|nr:TIGR04423 family type III CRISPR-associated protein [Bacteroidota bacterium]
MNIKLISKKDIPPFQYEGYLWYSDDKKPRILNGASVSESDLEDLPFVVEGLLYAENEQVSIRITNIDGVYHIAKMTLSNISKETQRFALDKSKFPNETALRIYQHYEAKADPGLGDDWQVLQPAWFAFLGFQK